MRNKDICVFVKFAVSWGERIVDWLECSSYF